MMANVRFGSKADISECPRDVRFTPKSGHWLSVSQCPLCAKSGHSARLRPSAGPVAPRAAVDVGDQRPGLIDAMNQALLTLAWKS